MKKKYPVKLPLSFLVANKDGIEKNLEKLGFQPEIYSPNFSLVDEQTVNFCNQKGIKIIPWTVNDKDAIQRLKDLGVDGIISDFPDLLSNK